MSGSGKGAGAVELLERVFPLMTATSSNEVPSRPENWLYELKYDGFRAAVAIRDGEIEIWSRNRNSLSGRFPQLNPALETLGLDDVVLDGEIVAWDDRGVPRFELVQQGSPDACLMVFDLLWIDGKDLRKEPIEERRSRLETLFKTKENDFVRLVDRVEGDLPAALRKAAKGGHEGLIGKRKGSKYESRRSRAWIKLKVVSQQEFAVVGFTLLKDQPNEIGALLLAVREGRSLRFAGRVGTGFSTKQRSELRDLLESDRVDGPKASKTPRLRGAVWVRPRHVAEVRFSEWTSEGMLRHPSFLGIREDKSVEEIGAAEKAVKGRSRIHVKFTSPDRVLYPGEGLTKLDLARYYTEMSGPILRALEDRPLALEHWNEGIEGETWFQQELPDYAPDWLASVDTPTRSRRGSVRHLLVDRTEALQWLAQQSVLTVHTWSSRIGSLDSPDWLIIDLDPAKGKGIEQAVEAALVFRRLFETLEIPSVPKTSGKRGLHLMVPLEPGYTHEEATDFACRVCEAVASQVEDVTVERTISKRKGRLYADCMQNGYGKTIVAPYSPRGLEGAPVSAPLKWSEVTGRLDPQRYTIRTMPKRFEKVGDLFEGVLEGGVKLPALK